MEIRNDIHAILFDYSGVIARKRQKLKQLLAQIERDFGTDRKALKRELERLELDGLSSQELGPKIQVPLKEAFGVTLPDAWIAARVSSDVAPEHVELVRRLHKEYRTAVVANSDGTLEGRIKAGGLRDLFDVVVDSDVAGVRKPDPGIYLLAASRLDVEPKNCLFIDDKAENVRGAEHVGMQGICFSFEQGDDLEMLLAQRGIRVLAVASQR